MQEEHLGQAGAKGDLPGSEPEQSQHLGHCHGGECEVSNGQHGQEEVHGLVEAALGPCGEQQDTISQQGCQVHGAEQDRDPDVQPLMPGIPVRMNMAGVEPVRLNGDMFI